MNCDPTPRRMTVPELLQMWVLCWHLWPQHVPTPPMRPRHP
jgi:hypothetical protein